MQKIYNDGTDQELYFKGVKSDLSGEFTGTIDGEYLPGAIVQIKEYKKSFVEISGAVIIWDAMAGYWFAEIPTEYITQSGSALVTVAGTGMMNVTIEADVLTVDLDDLNAAISAAVTAIKGSGTETLDTIAADIAGIGGSGAEKIIPAANYAFDASAKTITLASPYDTLTVEQVTFIKNLTTNYIIWDCRYAGYQTLPIRFGAAPNTHVLSFDSSDSDAANTDKIMIVVNQV